jgi:putative DNA primase/helicase
LVAHHGQTAVSVVRESYEQWCEQVGERPVSAKRLTQELQSRFGVADARGSKGQRFYTGVALLSSENSQITLPMELGTRGALAEGRGDR